MKDEHALQKTNQALSQRLQNNLVKYQRKTYAHALKFGLASLLIALCGYFFYLAVTALPQQLGLMNDMYYVLSVRITSVVVSLLGFLFFLRAWRDIVPRLRNCSAAYKRSKIQYKQHIAELEGGELSIALLEAQQGELSIKPGHIVNNKPATKDVEENNLAKTEQPDTEMIKSLHQRMVKLQKAKLRVLIGLGIVSIGLAVSFFLLIFQGELVLRWLTNWVGLSSVSLVFLGILIALIIPGSYWAELISHWDVSSKQLKNAKVEYEHHTAQIKGGELSVTQLEKQQGALTQSTQQGALTIDNEEGGTS